MNNNNRSLSWTHQTIFRICSNFTVSKIETNGFISSSYVATFYLYFDFSYYKENISNPRLQSTVLEFEIISYINSNTRCHIRSVILNF